jgi:hypothetical protein
MRLPLGFLGLFFLSGWAVTALGADGAVERSLVRVLPRSPWTLRELEARHLDLVSYDPDTGEIFLTVDAREQRALLDAGYALSTIEPDATAGLKRLQEIPDLGQYHTFAEMESVLVSLQATHPGFCRLEVLGSSLEGRPIYALKISDEPGLDDATEPDVLIVGNHHARELMTVEVPLHFAHVLLEQRASVRPVRDLVEGRETWIVPMLNPDGHVYQERTQGRPGWRKNRRENDDLTYGVDLNRNYSHMWGYDEEGSSSETVNEMYRGAAPFSEPETRALRDLVQRQDFVIAISYHSYGALLLYSWGWTREELTPDQDVFGALAAEMVRTNGYRPGNPYFGTIYLTNGEFDDYMYGELNAQKTRRTFSFTVELNTMAQGGFWPGDELIAPTCDLMLPLNMYAVGVADLEMLTAVPPARPVVSAHQEDETPWIVELTWTVPENPNNPVDHFEVYEIDPAGFESVRLATAADLRANGRHIVAADLPVPATGSVVLDVAADLEGLWDYAYVEARAGGDWQALPGEVTRTLDPTGRNSGNGMTGAMQPGRRWFDARAFAGQPIDLSVRLDRHPDSPRAAFVRARLDVAATFMERRRTLDDDVRDTRYTVVVERPGLFGYGVTAVNTRGLKTDGEEAWVWVPEVTAVEIQDIAVTVAGTRVEVSWTTRSATPARFEAWSRALRPGETPAELAAEWQRGDYMRRAARAQDAAGRASLGWDAAVGRHAVVLLGQDTDGPRVWGPWVVEVGERAAGIPARTRLHPAVPNPFNPRTRLTLDLARDADVRLEIFTADGRAVRCLVNAHRSAGSSSVEWDGRDDAGHAVASGVYVVRLQVAGSVQSQRIVLLR